MEACKGEIGEKVRERRERREGACRRKWGGLAVFGDYWVEGYEVPSK
jgi:hypothetical protein